MPTIAHAPKSAKNAAPRRAPAPRARTASSPLDLAAEALRSARRAFLAVEPDPGAPRSAVAWLAHVVILTLDVLLAMVAQWPSEDACLAARELCADLPTLPLSGLAARRAAMKAPPLVALGWSLHKARPVVQDAAAALLALANRPAADDDPAVAAAYVFARTAGTRTAPTAGPMTLADRALGLTRPPWGIDLATATPMELLTSLAGQGHPIAGLEEWIADDLELVEAATRDPEHEAQDAITMALLRIRRRSEVLAELNRRVFEFARGELAAASAVGGAS